MDLKQVKKYEETTALIKNELIKQGIPTPIFDTIIRMWGDFDPKNSELLRKDRTAFLIVLLAKFYYEGRTDEKKAEQTRKAGVHNE